MSRIKELKTSEENNLNLIEIFSLLCPEGKSKYVETLLRIMKNTKNYNQYANDVKQELSNNLDLPLEKFDGIRSLHLLVHYYFLQSTFNFGDLRTFKKFCELNERNLIVENDLSRYNSFDQILASVSLADLKIQDKETEKQIIKVFEDDEWLLVRPLTFLSSKKYGANTKWCTTSENNSEYFFKYVGKGILIYSINKKTGLKVGTFKELPNSGDDHNGALVPSQQFLEFSFWNQKDDRIDSLDSGLPIEILQIILKEIKDRPYTNISLLPDEFKTTLKLDSNLLDTNLLYNQMGTTTFAEPSPEEVTIDWREEVMVQQEVETTNAMIRNWNGGN